LEIHAKETHKDSSPVDKSHSKISMHQASCAMWNKMSIKIVESWYEDELVSHTSIQMMQYSLSVVKDSNRFPQSLQMEKLWECEAAGIKPNTNPFNCNLYKPDSGNG
jgi:hypothetical protein